MIFDSFSFDGETFGIDKRVPTELKSNVNFARDHKRWNYMKTTEEFVFIGGSNQLCQVSEGLLSPCHTQLRSTLFQQEKKLVLLMTG